MLVRQTLGCIETDYFIQRTTSVRRPPQSTPKHQEKTLLSPMAQNPDVTRNWSELYTACVQGWVWNLVDVKSNESASPALP